jgi:pyruvate/2-oxoglutarate dehydrogenase complex dihydrolipoamide acyltransferase (E2) component
MFGKGAGWGIPISLHTLTVTVGGIVQKPGVKDGHVDIREFLNVTISCDHDIVDGAPAARFAERLKELVEEGYGLHEESPA